jgi:hypothetical protein
MKRLIAIWLLCAVPTVVQASSPSPAPVDPTPAAATSVEPGDVWISELLPNPAGTDSDNEWLEIVSRVEHPVDASGTKVNRPNGTSVVTVPAGTIVAPGQYLLLSADSLINSGDVLTLTSAAMVIDEVTYTEAPEGQSWIRLSEEDGDWTSTPTPGGPNAMAVGAAPEPSTAPKAVKATARASAKSAKTKTKAASLPKSGLPSGLPLLTLLIGTLVTYTVWKPWRR